jgi:hypothetical protein
MLVSGSPNTRLDEYLMGMAVTFGLSVDTQVRFSIHPRFQANNKR